MSFESRRGGYVVSDDPVRLDLDLVCDYIRNSYWGSELSRNEILRSIENSLAFGLYLDRDQTGFARVVTDYARFAYLSDVFVLEAHRGRGMGSWLVEQVLNHPELRSVRKWMLATRDAHGFYRSLGFGEVDEPTWQMERRL